MRSRPESAIVWIVCFDTIRSASIHATPGIARTASKARGGNLALNPINAEV